MDQELNLSKNYSQGQVNKKNNKKDDKVKLVLYNKINTDKYNTIQEPFYYNEENFHKKKKSINFIFNNIDKRKESIFIFNNKNNTEKNINKFFTKKKTMINFVTKEDKNKNLKIFDGKNMNEFKFFRYKSKEFSNINNNKSENDSKNAFDANKNKSTSIDNNFENYTTRFNGKRLDNIKTNILKIISNKVIELPKPKICYVKKSYIYKKENIIEFPVSLPISSKCYFQKSYIYNEQKLILPKVDKCHFKKLNLTTEIKYKDIIVNKWYFCTKINKIKDNKIVKNPNSNYKESSKKLLKKKDINGINNLKKIKIDNKIFINKKINYKFQKDNKNNKNKNLSNNISKSFHSIYKGNQTTKPKSKNNIINHPIIITNKNKNKSNIEERNILQKNNIKKYPKIPNTKHHKAIINKINNYKQDNNDISSSSSSSYDKGKNHDSLFYHLLNSKDNKNFKNIFGLNKSKSNIFSRKLNNNGQSRNGIEKKILMPRINNNNSFKTPKTKNYRTVFSSKDLIKKINSAISSKNNNKNLTNFFKINKRIEGISTYHIMNYNNKDNENNIIKCDNHSNNEIKYPNCHNKSIKIKSKSFQDINNQLNPSIDKNLNSPSNQIIKRLKKDYFLSPLQINSRNRYKRLFDKFMKKNNQSRTIKKVNVSKYDEEMLKRYKGSLLAIKEYFNIK